MTLTLANSLFYAALFTVCLSFVLSLFYNFKKGNPSYFKLFSLYSLLSLSTENIVIKYFSKVGILHKTNEIPYNIFSLIEFIFFSYLALKIINYKRSKIIIAFFASLYAMLYIYFLLENHSFDFEIWKCVLPLNVYYIIIGILYLHYLTLPNISFDESEKKSFYIIIGIWFYSIITTPALFLTIYKTPTSDYIYIIINDISYIILHLLFIKAYTCKIKQLSYKPS
jgi:hypothetical protein